MIFKYKYLFLFGTITILINSGCAPYYKSLIPKKPNLKIMKVSNYEDSSIIINVQQQSVDVGAKYHSKAIISSVVHIKINVKNKTNDTITIVRNSLIIKDEYEESKLINIDNVIKQHKVGIWKYWWWSLLMGFITKKECHYSNCETSITPIPIGVFIGLLQFGRAVNYNINVYNDFKKAQMKKFILIPKSESKGFLYFDGLVSHPKTLNFEYKKGGEKFSQTLKFVIY